MKLYFTKFCHSLRAFSGCKVWDIRIACMDKADCQFFSLISVSAILNASFFNAMLGSLSLGK